MKKNRVVPRAIVNVESESIVAVGATISNVPAIDKPERNPPTFLRNGMKLRVNGDTSTLEVLN